MKHVIVFFSFLVIGIFSSISMAENNPQIRICKQLGGDFITATTDNDQVGLCQFGQSYIGSIDLVRFVDKSSADSIETYSNNIESCEPYAQTKQVQIVDGSSLNICVFSDGSIIDSQTLSTGRQNLNNAKINKALNL